MNMKKFPFSAYPPERGFFLLCLLFLLSCLRQSVIFSRHACRRPYFLLSPKKYAKMRPKGLRPLGTPFDEGLAVLG
ncbi:MAG: hypothetical protein FWC72_03735, partial [Oscillospiraceae bacterium]|nr:hypothetical protein [Oscillospiraceae bacterium]